MVIVFWRAEEKKKKRRNTIFQFTRDFIWDHSKQKKSISPDIFHMYIVFFYIYNYMCTTGGHYLMYASSSIHVFSQWEGEREEIDLKIWKAGSHSLFCVWIVNAFSPLKQHVCMYHECGNGLYVPLQMLTVKVRDPSKNHSQTPFLNGCDRR